MKNHIVLTQTQKNKNALNHAIEKKRKVLEDVMTKVEMLKIELDIIKHEYTVRIGALLLKDNQLDMEIVQLENLQELMRKGMSYEEAMKFEEDAYYSEILAMQKEQERINEEQKFLDNIKDVSDEVKEDIKTIWKKLIREFHPDLVMDPEEKSQREILMKKINKAYTDNDLDALKQFESTHTIINTEEVTEKDLEKMLEQTENMIIDLEAELMIMKKSTWYEWKKKMEKAGVKDTTKDIFLELENELLDDIAQKIEKVQKLRLDVIPKETTSEPS